LISASVFSN